MRKTLSFILLSLALVFTGCGSNVSDQPAQPDPVIEDSGAVDSGDEASVQQVVDEEVEPEDTSAEQPIEEITEIPDGAWDELQAYISGNSELAGIIPLNVCMFDVTEDGHEEICATLCYEDDADKRRIAIYDLENGKGYTLSGGSFYSYSIEGIEDGFLLITGTDKAGVEENVTGTVIFSYRWPVFIDNLDMLKSGLPYKIINMFGICAEELLPGDTSSGDYLSSMDFYYVREMLYKVGGIFYGTDRYEEEVSYGDGEIEHLQTELRRMPYDDWVYLVEEVFMEEDAANLLANLDKSFSGEVAVYYNEDDDCIYLEQGLIGDIIEWEVSDISKEGNRYVITYHVIGGEWLWTAEVTIEEADNTYGYSLISIEIINQAKDVERV